MACWRGHWARAAFADTTHDNLGSQRVMEKAGMRRTDSDERLVYDEINQPGLGG